MNVVRRNGQVVYEDLLRELEVVEQQLMQENSALAMSVMVLEAKLRDRFQQMELQTRDEACRSEENFLIKDDLSMAELQALIPRELPIFPEAPSTKMDTKKTLETVGLAAMLAMATACGVFGLATALQAMLGWLA